MSGSTQKPHLKAKAGNERWGREDKSKTDLRTFLERAKRNWKTQEMTVMVIWVKIWGYTKSLKQGMILIKWLQTFNCISPLATFFVFISWSLSVFILFMFFNLKQNEKRNGARRSESRPHMLQRACDCSCFNSPHWGLGVIANSFNETLMLGRPSMAMTFTFIHLAGAFIQKWIEAHSSYTLF